MYQTPGRGFPFVTRNYLTYPVFIRFNARWIVYRARISEGACAVYALFICYPGEVECWEQWAWSLDSAHHAADTLRRDGCTVRVREYVDYRMPADPTWGNHWVVRSEGEVIMISPSDPRYC